MERSTKYIRLKRVLPISVFLQWYGYDFGKGCPIHGGSSGNSFRYHDTEGAKDGLGKWYCWNCKANGDVIGLYAAILNRGISLHRHLTLSAVCDRLWKLYDQGAFEGIEPIQVPHLTLIPRERVQGGGCLVPGSSQTSHTSTGTSTTISGGVGTYLPTKGQVV